MPRPAERIRGLYVITPGWATGPEPLASAVAAALRGGARVVQYRDKSADAERRLAEAGAVAACCRAAGACFIVNDDVALAAAVGADGVHLGRDDVTVAAARSTLGAEAIVGVSCYDSLARARTAARAGADYVAFGSVFASPTKPQAVRAPLALFAEARAVFAGPRVAIGGITPGNVAAVTAAGADAVAVIEAVFAAGDAEVAARELVTRGFGAATG